MKKYITIILVTILAIFISNIPASAREMDLKELGESAIKLKKDTEYIYVIGKYAFTSEYQLKQQDIMLAAGSIAADAKDLKAALEKMNIQKVVPKYDKKFKITGWENGANLVGKTKLPTKFDIRYIDYTFFAEKSNATINLDIFNGDTYQTYTDILKEKLGFEAEKSYSGGKLTYKNGTLSGLLLKNDKITLKDEDKEKYQNTPYYFAYVLEVPNATEKTKITTSGMGRTGEIKWENFDIQKENGKTPGIVVLVPVIKTEWEKDKTYSITIDLDGETSADGKTGEEYEPTTYKLDLSGLTFQEESETTPTLDKASDKDKQLMTEGNYKSELNEKLKLEKQEDGTYKLTGKMKEQVLGNSLFNKDEQTGYFFDFTFVKPAGVESKNAKISSLIKEDGYYKDNKVFVQSEYDENGNLTILQRFDPETNCSDKEKCKLYFSVDWDGESDKYLPTIYTIDYSEVTLEKSSLFEIKALNSNDENTFDDDGWLDKKGYSIKIEQDKNSPNKYKLSGILPIFEDNEWEDSNDPLESNENDYYLGLILKLINAPKGFEDEDDKMSIKFLDSDGEDNNYQTVTASDFGTSQSLYILKYLVPSDESKEFEIRVDLDGDDNEEYAPYTVTIDYSDLEFQNYSLDNVDFDIIDENKLETDSKEKQELESYGFNPETVAGVTIKEEQTGGEERESSKTGLQGSIKEQTLNASAGFKENTGYFVPIKISVPTDEPWFTKHQNDWTITLYNEDGTTKVYTPTEEEHKQGWVMVLFIIDKDKSDEKVLKYEIDFDGDGDAFLPTEYKIKYEDLSYQTENKIKFEYFDETTGKILTKEQIVYEGEKIDPSEVPSFEESNYKYHSFSNWYDSTKSSNEKYDIENETTEANEDLTLKAHWNLNVEKFMSDVITDLNSKDTTNSNVFSDEFTLEKDGKNITIDIKSPNVSLTKLASTSIPGTIAYLLQRGEIKDITLNIDDQNIPFKKEYKAENGKTYTDESSRTLLDEEGKALKEEIVEGAKGAFDEALDKHEEIATLDELEYDNKSFTIKIGDTDPSVTLVKEDGTELTEEDKTYTFKFDSDFAVVNQNGELGATKVKDAVESEKNYSTVYVDGDITEDSTIELTPKNDVTIESLENASGISLASTENKTIKVESGDYVIDVKAGNGELKISNLELTGGNKAEVKVEAGANANVENLKLSKNEKETLEEGIYVAATGKLTATNLTFDGETHDVPTVRGERNKSANTSAKVSFKNSTESVSPFYDIIKHDSVWCADADATSKNQVESCKTTSYDDEYKTTDDTFYYVNNENKIDYTLVGFMNKYKFSGGMVKVVEKGKVGVLKPAELRTEDKTGSDTTLHFAGWGTMNTSTMNYSDLITDWSNIKVESNSESMKWYYAYYVEYGHKITINLNGINNIDSIKDYDKKEYHTYKLNDKTNGDMTIGELKKIDSDFAKMWDDIEKADTSHNKLMINGEEAKADTKISADVTLSLTAAAEMG